MTRAGAAGVRPPARVLIAEDHELDRELLRYALEGRPFTVTMVNDGEQALQRYRNETFDLVLLDLAMPALDGPATARAMRQWDGEHRRRRTPILAITAHVSAADHEASVRAGIDDVIAKPFTLATLHEMMQRWAVRREA